MQIYRTCDFAPGFIIADNRIHFCATDDFIANAICGSSEGFSVFPFYDRDWYPMSWLIAHGWFSIKFANEFIAWCLENGVKAQDIVPMEACTFVTRPGSGPRSLRTIGFTESGLVFIDARTVKTTADGFDARVTFFEEVQMICVQDWRRADPKGFDETVLGELLPKLADKEGLLFDINA